METGRSQIDSTGFQDVGPAIANATKTTPSKVDCTADLLDLLSVDASSQNGSELITAKDGAWVDFQCKF